MKPHLLVGIAFLVKFDSRRAKQTGHRMESMRLRAAAALVAIALAWPIYAQHGAARGGSSAHGGFAGHAGFAGHSGFMGARGTSRPASSPAQRRSARPGFGRFGAPGPAGARAPYRGPGFATARSLYRPAYGDRFSSLNRDRGRGSWLVGSYGYRYPGWAGYPYPYVIDPGFYDWGDSGDSDYGPAGTSQGYADLTPYPGYGDAGPQSLQGPNYAQTPAPDAQMPRPAYDGPTPAPEPEQAITVIFNNGRAPESIQNYMMNSSTLTDLDEHRYEQIPLNQIDLAATEQANRSRGLDFQVPAASR
jgi:hypothetical protein